MSVGQENVVEQGRHYQLIRRYVRAVICHRLWGLCLSLSRLATFHLLYDVRYVGLLLDVASCYPLECYWPYMLSRHSLSLVLLRC